MQLLTFDFRLVARSYNEEPRAGTCQRDRVTTFGAPMTSDATVQGTLALSYEAMVQWVRRETLHHVHIHVHRTYYSYFNGDTIRS